jgi:hypothetical protein
MSAEPTARSFDCLPRRVTDRIEIEDKSVDQSTRTTIKFYLYLPVTTAGGPNRGQFKQAHGDDDSSAVTFWDSKQVLVTLFRSAVAALEVHLPILES